jgi:hypothetical protein
MTRRLASFAVVIGATILWMVFAADVGWAADKRVALIVGNSTYQTVPRLPNPSRDASSVSKMFKDAGFDVVDLALDVGNLEFKRAIRKFESMADSADIAVVFYAGHGLEIGGVNYLIPVDARLASDRDADDEAITLERLVSSADGARRLRLIMLDACRDNPFLTTMRREKKLASRAAASSGLGRVEPTGTDTLIAYAAKAGSTAEDGVGEHSPFTTALLRNLTVPGLDIRLAFGRVRDEVLKATGNRQEPFVYGSLGGGNVSLVPAPVVQQEVSASDVKKDYELVEKIGTARAWQVFLGTHPKGFYADLARAQIERLSLPPQPPAPAPTTTTLAAVEPPRPPGRETPSKEALEWDKVKDSTDPSELQKFIRRFPDSPLAINAQQRMEILIKAAQEREQQVRAAREATRKAAEEARRQAELRKAEEVAAKKREEDERRAREAEAAEKAKAAAAELAAAKKRDEEERRAKALEAEQKAKAAEAERKAAEAKAKAEQVERERLAAEAAAKRAAEEKQAQADAERKAKAAEAERKAAEAKVKAEQAERERLAAEAAAKRAAEEKQAQADEADRKAKATEAERKAAEAKAKAEQAERERLAAEAAAKRAAEEKQAQAAEAARKAAEEKRKVEQAERERLAAEAAARALAEKQAREAEEARRKAEIAAAKEAACKAEQTKLEQISDKGSAGTGLDDLKAFARTVTCDRLGGLVVAALDKFKVEEAKRAASMSNSPELIRSAQTQLIRVGCLTGSVDGTLNEPTKAALGRYMSIGGQPTQNVSVTEALVAELSKRATRVCPIECKAGETLKGETCVTDEKVKPAAPAVASRPKKDDEDDSRRKQTRRQPEREEARRAAARPAPAPELPRARQQAVARPSIVSGGSGGGGHSTMIGVGF